ncbi:MAG TPA: hypothetical protein EYG09_04580 [Dehalococcoidia bacterium]|nr:hypothetical protein [Dehalococcoidia bacterium]
MKISFRIIIGLVVVAALATTLRFGTNRYGWLASPENDYESAAQSSFSPFVVGDSDPEHPLECGIECGEDVGYVSGSGGYAPNFDIEDHTLHSSVIVEGVAHITGPARHGAKIFESGMTRRARMDVASTINTPFVITVSETHKGPERAAWPVYERGATVGCLTYLQHREDARLSEGISGLFLISSSPSWDGDWVTMTIAENAPEWFTFTVRNFGDIDETIALIETVESEKWVPPTR